MRNKTSLMLMEQVVMILVFALSAALCVQVFVLADQRSQWNANRDQALLEAQNVVEILKGSSGDAAERLSSTAEMLGGQYEQGLLYLDYDADWNMVSPGDGVCRLTAQGVSTDVPGLGMAQVQVVTGDSAGEELEVLVSLDVAWQQSVNSGE